MTESEWLTCEEPQEMLDFLRGRISDRKLRLFVCAGCFLYSNHFWDESEWDALHLGERFADGFANTTELAKAFNTICENTLDERGTFSCALSAVMLDGHDAARRLCTDVIRLMSRSPTDPPRLALLAEWRPLVTLLRDVSGNPFRHRDPSPNWLSWNDGTVRKIAYGIYEDRAFDRMPILADALEDAGCDSDDILAHCRGPGPHVRGCWVVDLLLGKG
jgi:hypothetical protein